MPRPQTRDHLKPKTYDEIRAAKKPLEMRIPIYLEQEPIEQLEALREELAQARTRDRVVHEQMRAGTAGGQTVDLLPDQDVVRLLAEVDGAEAAVRETTTWFVLRKITPRGRKRFDEMIDAHPPTKEQVAEATTKGDEPPAYNPDTFAPALLSMTCVDPVLTVEEATELLDDWSITECTELFTACMAVNTGRRTVDLGKD